MLKTTTLCFALSSCIAIGALVALIPGIAGYEPGTLLIAVLSGMVLAVPMASVMADRLKRA
ncbi:MAG: hypothetical protein ACPGID_11340 [Rubricella sp.]